MSVSSSIDPLKNFKSVLGSKDLDQLGSAIGEIVDLYGYRSEVSYKLATLIEENNLPFVNFLLNFFAENPSVVSSGQLYVAYKFLRAGMYDQAAAEARNLLRRILAMDEIKESGALSGYRDLAVRAYLVISSVYTNAGARSYSLRLLRKSEEIHASQEVRSLALSEERSLQTELTELANADLDRKWEEFFHSGTYAQELYERCIALDFQMLAQRVSLISTARQFDLSFKVDDEEMLKEVFQITAEGEEKPILTLK